MVPGCRFVEARIGRLPCSMWPAEESTGPHPRPPIVWGSREPVAQVFHAGHPMVGSPSAAPVLASTAALWRAGIWATSRPPALYAKPWQPDVLPVATGQPTHPLRHSRTPSSTVPKTPDRPHTVTSGPCVGSWRDVVRNRRRTQGTCHSKEQRQHTLGLDASLPQDSRDVSTLRGWALTYPIGANFIISFPDGIYLNLYITCNFFSNAFLSLFYFILNSIFLALDNLF